jgi:outer membrane protein
MKRIIINSLLLLLLQNIVCAQETSTYSLQQSIDIALANNISVKQNGLLAEAAGINLKQAKTNIFPDLNASLEHGMNKGRSIDPFSNTYVNQSVNYAGYGLNMGLVLFNGMTLQNNIRQQSYAYDASKMEWQQAKDNLVLLVMFAYLQILNNEDLLTSAGVQKELSAKQLERLQILDSQGAISPAQLADVKGQLMSDELNILDIKNNLETSKLALAQLMNVPYNKMMKLERMNTDEFLTAYKKSSDEIYQTALRSLP